MRTIDEWKEALRAAIRTSMRAGDKAALAAAREVLAALDNAEAQDPSAGPAPGSGPIAGAASGVGAGEVARRILQPEEAAAIVQREIDEREDAAGAYLEMGQPAEAERLRGQASFLSSL